MAALCDFFSELGPKGLLSPVSLELKVGGEGAIDDKTKTMMNLMMLEKMQMLPAL